MFFKNWNATNVLLYIEYKRDNTFKYFIKTKKQNLYMLPTKYMPIFNRILKNAARNFIIKILKWIGRILVSLTCLFLTTTCTVDLKSGAKMMSIPFNWTGMKLPHQPLLRLARLVLVLNNNFIEGTLDWLLGWVMKLISLSLKHKGSSFHWTKLTSAPPHYGNSDFFAGNKNKICKVRITTLSLIYIR